MAGFAIRKLDDIPSIENGGVHWKPLQHYFGLTAFGANIYRATEPGQELIGEHDELSGGHEELYVVLDGVVRFTVNGEHHHCERGDVVVVRDPSIRRAAVAESGRASVLAIGDRPSEKFESTWNPRHFEGVPTVDD